MSDDREAMDAAAREARAELVKLDQRAVVAVAEWWRRYYMRAGHKRLARVLLAAGRATVQQAVDPPGNESS
ncbi:MAG: hypothetical protein HYX89_03755 [Chloroflexi bacterium]|nr:hypothetical protein [Chloroflexota bacterium]